MRGCRIFKSEMYYELQKHFLSLTKYMGYESYMFPNLCFLDLFTKKDATLNETKLFKFKDSKDRDICLKPEVTMSAIDYFVNSGLNRLTCSYSERCYRYEKPSKNRYREFLQIGLEHISNANEFQIVNVVKTLDIYLKFIKKKYLKDKNNFIFKINYIDCEDQTYMSSVQDWVENNFEKYSREAKKNIFNKEYLIAIDKNPEIKPKTCLNLKNTLRFKRILKTFSLNNINFKIDNSVVRGINYYSGIVFEITYDEISICGGGEYSSSISKIYKRNINGAGWAIGLDRLVSFLEIKEKDSILYQLIDIRTPLNYKRYIPIIKNFIKNKNQYRYSRYERD